MKKEKKESLKGNTPCGRPGKTEKSFYATALVFVLRMLLHAAIKVSGVLAARYLGCKTDDFRHITRLLTHTMNNLELEQLTKDPIDYLISDTEALLEHAGKDRRALLSVELDSLKSMKRNGWRSKPDYLEKWETTFVSRKPRKRKEKT